MHKLCYLIVLHFVVQIALGDFDECFCRDPNGSLFAPDTISNGFKCICPDPNGEIITPVSDKNVIFGERRSPPTMEQNIQNILQRLDSLEDSVKEIGKIIGNVSAKENNKFDALIASQNDIATLVKYVIRNTFLHLQSCRKTPSSGIYNIRVAKYGEELFNVYCENNLYGGSWIVVARRMDGSVDFANRTWTEYKRGFGDLEGEFFIGMDKLFALTNGPNTQELIFVLGDFNNTRKFAQYLKFAIGDESEEYKIKRLSNYFGNAGNSFRSHVAGAFQTKDRDTSPENCTKYGAWWYRFRDCYESNLFGKYFKEPNDKDKRGIHWLSYDSNFYSLKFAQMMIRHMD